MRIFIQETEILSAKCAARPSSRPHLWPLTELPTHKRKTARCSASVSVTRAKTPEKSFSPARCVAKGKDAQLQHLWQEVHAALQPEAAQAGARGRTAISLRRLWENFHNQQRVQDPSEGSPAGGRTGADWKNCSENLKHSVRSLLVLVIGLNSF